MDYKSEHTFHIPVMGTAFTIDSPIKVARFGISSVISIIEDRLIEMMRRHYYPSINKPYEPITSREPDYRAKRITDYLNLVNAIVQQQMQKLKSEAFEKGAEIVKYFEMLPKESRLKKLYHEMLHCTDTGERIKRQTYLRTQLVAGSIDVNIMTKVDRDNRDENRNIIQDGSEAVAALRGYMKSDLSNSSVVFSAGMNPRLFNYLENSNVFDPDGNFKFDKRVIVKVSDFRSAFIQGKYLAKKGIWVSEFRIESGLNCGGHAFATDGHLLGPILEEFNHKRQELSETIFEIYNTVIRSKLGFNFTRYPAINISVQGGIGTYKEDCFLRRHYQVSSTGWGTPFLLVPEATTVDAHTLSQLCAANEDNVVLSGYSPLGVRFYHLNGTTADVEKHRRIKTGKPGSPCTEKHLALNTEFTEEPICTASRQYQKLKLEHLKTLQLPEKEYEKQKAEVLAKECLCIGLSNAASLCYEEPFLKNLKAVTVCPGPNIVNYSKVVSLQTMTDHIYGRTNLVTNAQRPHMFIAEMKLYVKYLKEQLMNEDGIMKDVKKTAHYRMFHRNLSDSIQYYKNLQQLFFADQADFGQALQNAEEELAALKLEYSLD
ncbi:MAG: hypothetical protein DYG98_16105 [Haliscomenobacteraceae bacterium CHB4]|nr:hypothetical protein [Saprospiraceae bacterium]MCE7924571.1 hypothetical protein [Haliscomenobacteraceae bacterium CHB4]